MWWYFDSSPGVLHFKSQNYPLHVLRKNLHIHLAFTAGQRRMGKRENVVEVLSQVRDR